MSFKRVTIYLEIVLLDSSSKGEWDILSSLHTAYKLLHSLQSGRLRYSPLFNKDGGDVVDNYVRPVEMWRFLENWPDRTCYADGPEEVQFWGGFLGYFSYELGLKQLELDLYPNSDTLPYFDNMEFL